MLQPDARRRAHSPFDDGERGAASVHANHWRGDHCRSDSLAFTFDSFVSAAQVPKFCHMLVDFACLIKSNLERHGAVVVPANMDESLAHRHSLPFHLVGHIE